MDFIPIVIQLIAGAAGAMLVAKLIGRVNEGMLINLGAGLFGGLMFGQLLRIMLGWVVPDLDVGGAAVLMTSVIGGAVGGGALLFLIGSVGKEPLGGQR